MLLGVSRMRLSSGRCTITFRSLPTSEPTWYSATIRTLRRLHCPDIAPVMPSITQITRRDALVRPYYHGAPVARRAIHARHSDLRDGNRACGPAEVLPAGPILSSEKDHVRRSDS